MGLAIAASGYLPTMHSILARSRPPAFALILLVLAAVAFAIGGVDHARLYHRGYAQVDVVGPLFLLNAIGTIVVLALLAAGRVRLFVLGVLAISLGSIVSIVVSHSSSFFGFSEGGWDTDATLIVAAEAASVLLVAAAGALGALSDRPAGARPGRSLERVGPLLAGAGIVVLLVAIAGAGMGHAPKNDPAPSGPQLAASKRAIAAGGADVQRGRDLFEAQHCDSCHAIAATGADGRLGPRMDAQDDPLRDIAGNITDPRADIKPGFEGKLMPTDYASRMTAAQIKDVAAFVKAASTTGAGHDGG